MIIFIFYTLATLAVLLGLMFSYTYFGLHANKMYDLPKVCCACLSQTNNLKHVNNSASVDEELLSIFNYFMIDLVRSATATCQKLLLSNVILILFF